MPDEGDYPLPSWLRSSSSKAKQSARHVSPDPRQPTAQPIAGPSRRSSSSRPNQPIEISDDDSDIAISAPSSFAKKRRQASRDQAEHLRKAGSASSRGRGLPSFKVAGEGTSEDPFVFEDSPPPIRIQRSNPTPSASQSIRRVQPPALDAQPAHQDERRPFRPSDQASVSRSSSPASKDQSDSRHNGIAKPQDTPAEKFTSRVSSQQSASEALLKSRPHRSGIEVATVDMHRPAQPLRVSQLPSSQPRPHPLAHLPAPSPTPTVYTSSLCSRFSSPEKVQKQERKGGFGSHKKQLDPNRTIIGRTLSKEQAVEDARDERTFSNTPTGSREIKPFPHSQRSGAIRSSTARQTRPWHDSPSLSPTKPSRTQNLPGSSFHLNSFLPDSPPPSLGASAQDRGAPPSHRDSASSTLTPKKTVSRVKSEPHSDSTTMTYPRRTGQSSFKPAKPVARPESSAKHLPNSGPTRAKRTAATETRAHSNNSNTSAQSESSRPKRARPATGAYTVPGLDSTEWPSSKGSMGTQKKFKSAPSSTGIAKASAGVSKPSKRKRTRSASAVEATPPRRSESVVTLGTPATPSPGGVDQGGSQIASPVDGRADARRSRSATSSPLTEVESDENKTPTKTAVDLPNLAPVQEEVEEEDLTAIWDDYDFSAPSPEADKHEALTVSAAGEGIGLARTPSKRTTAGPRSPSSTDTGPPPRRAPVSPVVTPSKRRLSEHESAAGSPQSSVKRRLLIKGSERVAELVAAREASKQAALEEETRKIEERLRAAESLSDEDDDDELEDMTALITRDPSPVPKQEPVKQNKLPRPVPKKKVRHIPSKFDKLVDQVRQDAADGLGDPDSLLKDFASLSPEKEANFAGSENEASDAVPAGETPQLDSAEVHATLSDLPVDAGDIEVLRDVAEPEAVEETAWTGFWAESGQRAIAERGVCPAPVLQATGLRASMLQRAIERVDMQGIALCMSRPGLESVFRIGQNASSLAHWLLDMALTSPTPDAGNAVLALRRLIAIDSQGAKTFSSSCSLTSILLAVLFRSGMSPIVTDVENLPALPAVALERDAVCELVCAIASAAAPYPKTASVHGLDLAWVLLALATDENTSEPLLRAIDHALPPLWTLATRTETPIEVAAQLVGAASHLDLPMKAKARLVLRIGCRTAVQRDLARWVAIGLLVPTSIDADKIEAEAKRPDIDLVIAGADSIYTALQVADPDHAAVRAQLVLLTEACSDLYTLIEDAGGRGSDELDHFKELVMRAERMIVHKAFSKDKDYENKTRLGQLHMSLRRIEETITRRRERAKVAKMKSLKEGQGGQLRLSVGQKLD